MSCGKCAGKLLPRTFQIQCDTCKKFFHGACVNMGQSDTGEKMATEQPYYCATCASGNDSEPTLRDVLNEIKKLREEQQYIGNSVKSCHDELRQLRKTISEQETKIKVCDEKLEHLVEKNNSLVSEIKSVMVRITKIEQDNNNEKIAYLEDTLEKKEKEILQLSTEINNLDQYHRNKNLEIYGLQESHNENLHALIMEIASKLNISGFTPDDIDAIHRLPNRDARRPKSVVVQFCKRKIRDSFLSKGKQIKITNRDIILNGDSNRIYLNAHLTPANKKLFWKVKEFKREHNYKHVWINKGLIYLKRTDESPVIKISSEKDIPSV